MSLVALQHCHAIIGEHFHLKFDELNIRPLQHTVLLGPNGSGKSALAAFIAGVGELVSGHRHVIEQLAWVSIEQQQALIEAEKQKDCADLLDIIPVPTKVREILFAQLSEQNIDQDLLQRLYRIFSLSPLLEKPFQGLSTGETRKLLLTRAILSQPQLLILDEPWDGLDQHSCQELNLLLEELAKQLTLLLVVNRLSEVPAYCRQLVLLQAGTLQWQNSVANNLPELLTHIAQLRHMQQQALVLPVKDDDRFAPHPLDSNAPLVKLTQAKVSYGEQVVFSGLDWTIMPNHHWQVTGPNGSGKTCLLNLINGDHPQCYVNDIQVFGFQRGTGESIWQIKQYIGYMSNGLHLDYRVNCSVLHVILSGFYDSIGLYQTPTHKQKQLAQQWLALMALDEQQNRPFQQLSFGDQRLVLIARAMVKHPALLVLDEPCNGLDDINRLKVLALIELLAREGNTTLLYVNHHQEDVIPSITQHLSMTDY
jgi:molybdate transport system ATP-binding protein